MTDPKRWLEDASAASLEARVLGVALAERPPAGLEDRAWADFVQRLGPALDPREPPGAGEAGGGHGAELQAVSSATSTALGVAVLKATGVGALLGVLTITAAQALGPRSQGTESSAGAVATGASSRPSGAASAGTAWHGERPSNAIAEMPPSVAFEQGGVRDREAMAAPDASSQARAIRSRADELNHNGARVENAETHEEAAAQEQASRAAFPSALAEERASLGVASAALAPDSALRAEALELAQAKNLLQQGRAGEAEALLVRGSQRFANGALAGERELLRVEALSRLGRADEARRRARAFLARNPDSSISVRMQRLLGPQ